MLNQRSDTDFRVAKVSVWAHLKGNWQNIVFAHVPVTVIDVTSVLNLSWKHIVSQSHWNKSPNYLHIPFNVQLYTWISYLRHTNTIVSELIIYVCIYWSIKCIFPWISGFFQTPPWAHHKHKRSLARIQCTASKTATEPTLFKVRTSAIYLKVGKEFKKVGGTLPRQAFQTRWLSLLCTVQPARSASLQPVSKYHSVKCSTWRMTWLSGICIHSSQVTHKWVQVIVCVCVMGWQLVQRVPPPSWMFILNPFSNPFSHFD